MQTIFDIEENSGNTFFIMCNEREFEEWKSGNFILIKDPSTINSLFEDMGVNQKIEPNSFLDRNCLNSIPAKAVLKKISLKLPSLEKHFSLSNISNFAEGLDNNISLLTLWNTYNKIESENSPFCACSFLKEAFLKIEKDFLNNQSLYEYVKKWNTHHIRFFSELFSTYSIFTVRPKYYDEDNLYLNIFHKNILINKNEYRKVYCISLTPGY